MQIRITKPGVTGPNPEVEAWHAQPKEFRGPRPAEFLHIPVGTILTVLPAHGEIHIVRGYAELANDSHAPAAE